MTFQRQPVLIASFVAIAIDLAISFGLKLDGSQVALINALVVAGMALFIWPQVTPVAAPKLAIGTPVLVDGTGDQPPPDAVVALATPAA